MGSEIVYKRQVLASIILFSCSKEGVSPTTTSNTITTSGHMFSPLLLNCNVGDTIFFELGPTHNAIEVSEENYNANNPNPLTNGFQFDYGESAFYIANESKTYYYVCTPHLPQMKARIVVQ